ncbi:MAG: hypothetical protein ACYTF1_13110, partial [Planctomycetota bacterium]
IFLKTYGPYLARLEKRAPTDLTVSDTDLSQPVATEPLPTNIVVAIAVAAYGLLIIVAGLIWTQGNNVILNLLAGGALLITAAIVWKLGRN